MRGGVARKHGPRDTPPGMSAVPVAEHDMDAVSRLADRISVLFAGRVIATGPPEAIRADAELRRAYLGDAA